MSTRHRLSPHFIVEEFDCRDGSRVLERDYRGLSALCHTYLEPIRLKFGAVHVNSGYRSPAYNARIGGATRSFHIYTIHDGDDQAVDISCQKGSARDWHREANRIRQQVRHGKGGLGLYPSFVHIDQRDYKADWRG